MSEKIGKSKALVKLCVTGMFAAFICVATMLIRIPMPICGYVNFGDCFVILAAWILGPVYGFAAGGIGSALADLLAGYAQYIPGTFVIKGLVAVAAALIAHAILRKSAARRLAGYAFGALAGELIMLGGYFLYEAAALGYGLAGAFSSVAGNAVQGAFGAALSVILAQTLAKTGALKKYSGYAFRD